MIAQQAPGRRRAKNRARWSGAALYHNNFFKRYLSKKVLTK